MSATAIVNVASPAEIEAAWQMIEGQALIHRAEIHVAGQPQFLIERRQDGSWASDAIG